MLSILNYASEKEEERKEIDEEEDEVKSTKKNCLFKINIMN